MLEPGGGSTAKHAGKVHEEERRDFGRPPRPERAGRFWEVSAGCVEAPVGVGLGGSDQRTGKKKS